MCKWSDRLDCPGGGVLVGNTGLFDAGYIVGIRCVIFTERTDLEASWTDVASEVMREWCAERLSA